jgi:hypothetical protein
MPSLRPSRNPAIVADREQQGGGARRGRRAAAEARSSRGEGRRLQRQDRLAEYSRACSQRLYKDTIPEERREENSEAAAKCAVLAAEDR